MERAAILCKGNEIKANHIIIEPTIFESSNSSILTNQPDSEKNVIIDALEKAHWNRREAAKLLGMPYSTLRYKMDTLGIS